MKKNMTGGTGLRQKILDVMRKEPKELFSAPDLMEIIDEKIMPIENSLRTIRIDQKIHRHKEKDVNGDYQYAVSISSKNIEPYVKVQRDITTVKSKKKSKTVSTKELRSMFAELFNHMAKLEDAVMTSMDRLEKLEKEINHIKNFIGK